MKVKLSDLSKMSPEEREKTLGDLVNAALNPTPEMIVQAELLKRRMRWSDRSCKESGEKFN